MAISIRDLLNKDLYDVNEAYRTLLKINKELKSQQFEILILELIDKTYMLQHYVSNVNALNQISNENIKKAENLHADASTIIKDLKFVLQKMEAAKSSAKIREPYMKKIEQEVSSLSKALKLIEVRFEKFSPLLKKAQELMLDKEMQEIFYDI